MANSNKKYWYSLFISLFLLSCTNNEPAKPQMILEGWIDTDGFPVVLLHSSYTFDNYIDHEHTLEDVIQEHLIMFGRVSISDGENEVVLTGRLDTCYLPPYTYSTINMLGQEGKVYIVTATYKEMKATATTTLLPAAKFDSICIRKNVFNDTTKNIIGYLNINDIQEPAYYAVFMKYGDRENKQFKLCPLCVFDSSIADSNGRIELVIYNPYSDKTDLTLAFTQNFLIDLSYQIKLSRIDYESYRFWSAYSSQSFTQGIFFMPIYNNINGNVEGGLGNFTGMGSSIYTIQTSVDTTYVY